MPVHVYYQDPKFIFFEMDDKIREERNGRSFQSVVSCSLAHGTHSIYMAHEIWYYDVDSELFRSYKSRSGNGNLISSFLERQQINLFKIDDDVYCFATPKDSFVFNMKFRK